MLSILRRLREERERTCCPELAAVLLDAEAAIRAKAPKVQPAPAEPIAPKHEDAPGRPETPAPTPRVPQARKRAVKVAKRASPARKAATPRRVHPKDVAALRAKCREMRDRGLTLQQIGRKVGLHHSTVLYHLSRS